MRVIEQAAWRAQPWKNGRGTTHEIWRLPELAAHSDDAAPAASTAAPADDVYDLRISVAELTESGPFSRFPGYRRWSFLVGTAPVELTYDQRASREPAVTLVAPGDHVQLPGDVAITAHLRAGATHLFNILARVSVVAGHGPVGHPVRFVFALAPHELLLRGTDVAEGPVLARWAAAVLDPPAVIDTTDCIWVTGS